MKKEDLRIGNFYMSVKFGIPVECTLADLYELCVKSDGAYGDPPIEEMFEPIPLTEEWLLGFGFKRTDTVGFLSNRKMGLFKGRGRWRVLHHNTAVRYVHQLQNLYFALTGEELIRKEK